MSQNYTTITELEKYVKSNKRKRLLVNSFTLGCLFLVPLWVQNNEYVILILIIVLSFLSGVLTHQIFSSTAAITPGIEGETSIKNILLGELPDNYKVLNNITVEDNGRFSEIDFVIISPYCLFVIENKNHKGFITGSVEDKKWEQHKISQSGERYTKEFYNPIKQVSTHKYRLINFLKENKTRVWVESIIYFSNPDAEVFIKNESDTKVFSVQDGPDNLLKYIINYEKPQNRNPNARFINEQVAEKIIAVLKENQSE